jgi:hypothetical protein
MIAPDPPVPLSEASIVVLTLKGLPPAGATAY